MLLNIKEVGQACNPALTMEKRNGCKIEASMIYREVQTRQGYIVRMSLKTCVHTHIHTHTETRTHTHTQHMQISYTTPEFKISEQYMSIFNDIFTY